jgi:hypothetical protein
MWYCSAAMENCSLHCTHKLLNVVTAIQNRRNAFAVCKIHSYDVVLLCIIGDLDFSLCKIYNVILQCSRRVAWNLHCASCVMHQCSAIPKTAIPLRKLRFRLLQYGTGDLHFSLRALYYTLLRHGTGDYQFALCKMHYALLHCSTYDFQFALWKLYYEALLCHTVNFSKMKNI